MTDARFLFDQTDGPGMVGRVNQVKNGTIEENHPPNFGVIAKVTSGSKVPIVGANPSRGPGVPFDVAASDRSY